MDGKSRGRSWERARRQQVTKSKKVHRFPGDDGEGEPPVPIPNTAVKPLCADGTCRVTGWESRTLPGINLYPGSMQVGPGFLV